YQIASSDVSAMRRGRERSAGSVNALNSSVLGSIVPILFVPKRSNQGCSCESSSIPYGREPFAIGQRRTCPLARSNRPTYPLFCAVNQATPFLAHTIVWGSRTAGSSATVLSVPELGSMEYSFPFPLPVNQTPPRSSRLMLCGRVPSSIEKRLNCPEAGSR